MKNRSPWPTFDIWYVYKPILIILTDPGQSVLFYPLNTENKTGKYAAILHDPANSSDKSPFHNLNSH